MNTINNGGPAFPLPPVSHHGQVVALKESDATGMALRDYFAAKAMQALIQKYSYAEAISRNAYVIADAMLLARESECKSPT